MENRRAVQSGGAVDGDSQKASYYRAINDHSTTHISKLRAHFILELHWMHNAFKDTRLATS
jgi:hypothetical protein